MDYFSNCYDNGYTNSSTSLFQFYLSQWQFPHPILTSKKIKYDELNIEINEPRKNLQIIKPYSVILKILNEMFYQLFLQLCPDMQSSNLCLHTFSECFAPQPK